MSKAKGLLSVAQKVGFRSEWDPVPWAMAYLAEVSQCEALSTGLQRGPGSGTETSSWQLREAVPCSLQEREDTPAP